MKRHALLRHLAQHGCELFRDRSIGRYFLLILALSLLVRLGAAFYLGDTIEVLPGTYDQRSYDALARRVLTGHGFSYATDWWPATRADEPTAHFSFLYSLFLAGVYAVFGFHPLAARVVQALIVGPLTAWLLYRLGRRLFNPTVALAAAGLSAVYAYFIYYAAALMTESFFILCVLAALDSALELAEKPSWKTALSLGIALGLGILLRQTLLLFLPFLLLWLLWQARGRIRWFYLALPLLVIALLIAPWTVRNYLVFHRFVLLNTNAGFAFFWANHPIHGTYSTLLKGNAYQELIPPELRSLNEAELDAALLRLGLGFVWADPGRYVLLCLNRIPEHFKFWPSPESGLISNISRVGSFGLLLPLMLYGLYLPLRRTTPTFQRSTLNAQRSTLLYLFVLVYCGIHLLTWAGIRYRLPVDAVLILFAGLALVEIWERLPGKTKAARPA
jgi:4-amino-4-deoxy-L-arabinose transferase-like glycosyltransferase